MILLCFGVVQKTLTIADLNTLRCWCVRAVRSKIFYKHIRHLCAGDGAARQKDCCPCKINPGDRPSFLPGQIIISIRNLWVKTRAEHGSGLTEEAQTLLSKKDKIINLKQLAKILNRTHVNLYQAF